jgi:hypothetical protein
LAAFVFGCRTHFHFPFCAQIAHESIPQDGISYYFFDAATAPSNGHPLLAETPVRVKYTIHPDETYTLEINGNFVQKDGSQFVPWRTTGPPTGFNVFAIGAAFGPNNLTAMPFYIDNLVITAVPEPTSLVLARIVLAGAAGLVRRRR